MRNQCKAHRKSDGQRCGNAAMLGQNICRMHGGAAPQSKKKAQERILAAADAAAAHLVALMKDPAVPYTVQLAAARDLLDRAGVRESEKVELTVKKYEELIDSGELVIDIEEPDPSELANIIRLEIEGHGR